MGTYERKVNQLKDLMIRKYKSAYDKSKEMDIDISSMTYLPIPDAFNVINIEKMHVILDRVNKIIDDNKDKLKNPTCATCIHLHDQEWAKSDNRSPEEKHEEEMRFCKDLNDLRCEMLIDMAKKIEEYLL